MADDSKHDINTIGHVAASAADRRTALDVCLTQHWLNEDIARLERRDEPGWNGWDMWKNPFQPAKNPKKRANR